MSSEGLLSDPVLSGCVAPVWGSSVAWEPPSLGLGAAPQALRAASGPGHLLPSWGGGPRAGERLGCLWVGRLPARIFHSNGIFKC